MEVDLALHYRTDCAGLAARATRVASWIAATSAVTSRRAAAAWARSIASPSATSCSFRSSLARRNSSAAPRYWRAAPGLGPRNIHQRHTYEISSMSLSGDTGFARWRLKPAAVALATSS